MSLRIRRGTDPQRTGQTFDQGEIVYTTDTQKIYVGDGVTAGGIHILASSAGVGLTFNATTQAVDFDTANLGLTTAVVAESGSGVYFTSQRAQDAVGTLISNGTQSHITVTYDSVAHSLSFAVAADQIGITSVSQDTTPTLGGNLTLNSHNITGTGNINITGSVSATDFGQIVETGTLILNKNLSTGGLQITTNAGGDGTALVLAVDTYTNDTNATVATFIRSKGTFASPLPVVANDQLFTLAFVGKSSNGTNSLAAAISGSAGGTVSAGIVPGALTFATADLSGTPSAKLTIGPTGLQTIVAPALIAGGASGQVDTGTIVTWMKVNFNGVDYAVPMYDIRA